MDEQPNHRPALQRFVTWLEGKHAVSRQRTSHDAANYHDFVPAGTVREYLKTSDRLRQIFVDLFPDDEHRPNRQAGETIIRQYSLVFAILVTIGRARYIDLFIPHDELRDDRLPFQRRPDRFPHDTSGVNAAGDDHFFNNFRQTQPRFSAPILDRREAHRIGTDRILPFLEKEHIGDGGSSKVYKVLLHAKHDDMRRPGHETAHDGNNFYALKSFEIGESQKWHDAEIRAFKKFGKTGLEDTNMVGYYGSFVHEGVYHLVLEYADMDTLEHFISTQPRPETNAEILAFWDSIQQVLRAIIRIHSTDEDPVAKYEGVHQDIKPQNILVQSRVSAVNVFESIFGLSDLGTSQFKKTLSHRATRDGHGTKAYGPPECFRQDAFDDTSSIKVTGSADIWSFACVVSELAVWVRFGKTGEHGVDGYRERRRLSSGRNVRGPECFHHDGKLSPSVVAEHDKLLSDDTRCDALTLEVVKMVQDVLAPDPEDRPNARQFRHRFNGLVTRSRQAMQNRNSTSPRSEQKSTMSSHSPDGVEMDTPLQQHLNRTLSTPSGKTRPNAFSNERFLDEDRQTLTPRNLTFDDYHPQDSTTRVTRGPPATEGLPAQPSSHGPLQPTLDRAQSMPYAVAGPSHRIGEEGAHRAGTVTKSRAKTIQTPSTLRPLTVLRRQSLDEVNGDTGGVVTRDQPTIQTVPPPPTNQHEIRHRKSVPAHSGSPPPHPTHEQVPDNARPAAPEGGRHRRPPAELNFATAQNYMRATQGGQRHADLPGREFLTRLENRDHVIFVDDSSSMWAKYQKNTNPNTVNIRSLIRLLGWMTKKQDPDGVDMYFLNSSKKVTKCKRSSILVDSFHATNFGGVTSPRTRLKPFLEEYTRKILRYQQTLGKQKSKWLPLSKDPAPPRELSVYVLTDGVWESPENLDVNNGEYLDSTIVNLVEALVAAGLDRGQVGIQFISFGEHGYGKARLDHLDRLNVTKELALDIVDTEPATGNIWKMLLGAINRRFDNDDLENGS